jgi:isoamyl acetate esterase
LEKVPLLTRTQQDKTVDPNLECTIDPTLFTHGFNNIVARVLFSDGVCWVARIQHSAVDASKARRNTIDVLSEIATLRTAKDRTSIPVPDVFAYNVLSSNEVGYPYMLMEHLPGRMLGETLVSAVPPEHLPKVAKQFAEVLYQLHGLTFGRLGRLWRGEDGSGPLEVIAVDFDNASDSNSDIAAPPTSPLQTSLEWFYTERQQNNRRALETHLHDPEWTTACWVLKAAIPYIIIEDRVRGPFPLSHLDLHHGNLLFDDDYNLTGVIDWSHAQTVPLKLMIVSPEYITFPGAPAEENNKIRAFKALIYEHLQRLERAGCAIYRLASVRRSRGGQIDNDFFEGKGRLARRRFEEIFAHHLHAATEPS